MNPTITTRWLFLMVAAGTGIASHAQIFTTIASFDNANGVSPSAALTQGLDGKLYGTTSLGGSTTYGTIFNVTPEGALTSLHSFSFTEGANPAAPLLLAPDGSFFGTAFQGGDSSCGGGFGCGTVFRFTPERSLMNLHSFGAAEGDYPRTGLVQAIDGNLYGTTLQGGNLTGCGGGCGDIFKVTPTGDLITVFNFTGTDGGSPVGGALVQAIDGSLYGTTSLGGTVAEGYPSGTVFKLTAAGTPETLLTFNLTDGEDPSGGLFQGADGSFYGTTLAGGSQLCSDHGCGVVFRLTPAGVLTILHSFDFTDGEAPLAGVIQATDGNFYGITTQGGTSANCINNCGTIFKLNPTGKFTTIYNFKGGIDGREPNGLLQATDGNLYGTTPNGGATGDGSVFRVSLGLAPFVKPLPHFGNVGSTVRILGTDLTGATGVSFNGVPAAFTIVSPSEISTTVPAGATTGTVEVVTANGTLASPGYFFVAPKS